MLTNPVLVGALSMIVQLHRLIVYSINIELMPGGGAAENQLKTAQVVQQQPAAWHDSMDGRMDQMGDLPLLQVLDKLGPTYNFPLLSHQLRNVYNEIKPTLNTPQTINMRTSWKWRLSVFIELAFFYWNWKVLLTSGGLKLKFCLLCLTKRN